MDCVHFRGVSSQIDTGCVVESEHWPAWVVIEFHNIEDSFIFDLDLVLNITEVGFDSRQWHLVGLDVASNCILLRLQGGDT